MSHYRTLFDAGKYLGSWHLPRTEDVTVTIEWCKGGILKNAKTETKKPILKFKGKTLLLALNKTNAKTMERLHGTEFEAWEGKNITLYVGRTRDPDGGGQIDCIRIRPKVGTASDATIDEGASE